MIFKHKDVTAFTQLRKQCYTKCLNGLKTNV